MHLYFTVYKNFFLLELDTPTNNTIQKTFMNEGRSLLHLIAHAQFACLNPVQAKKGASDKNSLPGTKTSQ